MVEYRKYKIYIDRDDARTKFLQNSETGEMMGRKRISKGPGDGTMTRRVKSPKSAQGQIFGRSSAIPVRADSNKRATLRRSF